MFKMRLEGLRRVDVPEIDKEAFREAITNAFCHRDYYEYDSVNIAVFKDRMEVRSPGLLYGGLTIDQIKREMASERRNELIAELFHKVHIIEKWGRGISLILSKEPDTEFKEVGTHFVVVFKRKEIEKDTGTTPLVPSLKTRGEITGEGVEKGVEKGVDRGVEKLSEKENIILRLIKENAKISKQEISKKGNLSKKSVEYNITLLKDKGLLRRIGAARGGYWEVAGG